MANVKKKIRELSRDEKAFIKKAFDLFDTDNDGYIDYYETKAAMIALGFKVKKSQLNAIMKAYDTPDENKMNFQDFYYVMADKMSKRDPVDEIKHAFQLFTAESPCGKITLIDLQKINETLQCRLSEEEMCAMIEEFDTDQDGSINEAEFIEIMSSSTL